MLLKYLLLCTVPILASLCLAGNVWYVDPNGKNNATGAIDDPCKTLVEVMEKVTPDNGDIVYAAPGVYDNGDVEVDGIKYRVSIPAGTKLVSLGTRENTFLIGKADTTENAVNGCGPEAVRCGYLADGAEIHGFTITGGRDDLVNPIDDDKKLERPGGLLGADKNNCIAYSCVFSNLVTRCRGGALNNIISIGCYFADNSAGDNVADSFQTDDAYSCVFGPTKNYHVYYNCYLYNCTLLGNVRNSYVYNSLILGGDSGNNQYFNSFYVTKDGTTTVDDDCVQISKEDAPYDSRTFAPLPTSKVIDAGNSSYIKPVFESPYCDYLGNPRIYGNVIDIGAVESRTYVKAVDTEGLDITGLDGELTMIPLGGLKVTITRNYKTALKVKGIRINGGELFEFEGESCDRIWEGEFADGQNATIEVVYVDKNDWYVDAVNGNDGNDGYTPYRARRTLKAAMELPHLRAGEIVHAAAGVYDEGEMWRQDVDSHFSGSNRVIVAAGVGLVSTNAELTVIKGRPHGEKTAIGSASVRCVFLEDGSWIENFTVTNGFARGRWDGDGYGGGVCSVGGAVVGCRIVGCSSASLGKLVYGGTFICCYCEDSLSHSNHQFSNLDALINSVVGKGTVRATSLVLNSNLNGNMAESTAYNSYVYYDAGQSRFYSSRLYYGSAETSSIDNGTEVNLKRVPLFDSQYRPSLNDERYCDAGDRNWYDTLFPERWARFKGRDYAGGQRIYNGKIDIGAGEADWRGVYTAALSARRTLVAEASSGVTAGEKALNLAAGDTLVLRLDTKGVEGAASLAVVSDGDVSVMCDGKAASKSGNVYTFVAGPGIAEVTISVSSSAVISDVRLPAGGLQMILR